MNFTLNGRRPIYPDLMRSISWLRMPWLLASSGHQHPCYGLHKTGRYLSYMRNKFIYQCHVVWGEYYKTRIHENVYAEKCISLAYILLSSIHIIQSCICYSQQSTLYLSGLSNDLFTFSSKKIFAFWIAFCILIFLSMTEPLSAHRPVLIVKEIWAKSLMFSTENALVEDNIE